jgi:glyoxylase-like metal-dependent hydrolase (beta-lactamase superfamily II)
MMVRTMLAVAFVIAIAGSSPAGAQPATPAPVVDREITPLRGDLYRVRVGEQHTVFLVTPDGIVLVDPLSVATAQWLADEFATRFPGLPVRYVVHTQHGAQRAAGAAVFRKTAEIVAHAEFRAALNQASHEQPGAYRFVTFPTSTFRGRHSIELGGKTVVLMHAGPFHTPDLTVMAFPGEGVAFAVDPPPVGAVPFDFGVLRPAEVVNWLEAVARLDFDTMMFGDGTTLPRDAIAPLAEYLSRLRGAVLIGYERGRSLETLQDTLLLDAYRTLPHYAARREHIAAIYRRIRFMRADVTATALANYSPADLPVYCALYELCTAGGVVPAASVGVTIALGQRFGVHGELTASEQFWSTRTRPAYDEEVVLRPSRGALFFRYSPLAGGRVSYALLAGVSRTFGDVRGMNRVVGRLAPTGGRHPIAVRDARGGFTAGVDLSTRVGRLRIVLPIRVTQVRGELPSYWPGRFDVHAGAGIALPFFQRLE